jgi:1-acyl-sn-glycerol-3-phosphate acyltransferase
LISTDNIEIMKQVIFSLYFWLMFLMVTLLGLVLLPPFLLVESVVRQVKVDAALRKAISIYGWILVRVVPFFAPVVVEPRSGKLPQPAILVPNHNSAVDPYLFGALLLNDVGFVTSWSFKIPVYGFLMHWAKYINVNDGWDKVCRQSAALLQSGTSLLIWPEGHRSRDGRLGRFKNGAFALAVKTGYPLVPVCTLGSGRFLPPGRFLITPSRVKLILLDPIYPNPGHDEPQEIIRLRDTTREVIRQTLQAEQALSRSDDSRDWQEEQHADQDR